MEKAKVLLLYTDRYYLIKQVYPFGLDRIANYLRQYGHDVTIEYPFLPGPHFERNVSDILEQERPDVIGLGIRNLDTCLSCEAHGDYGGDDYRTFYFLPDVKKIVNLLKKHSRATIIVGGGGFTISPKAILKYLNIEYGVVGEGEEPLRQFIEAFPDKKKITRISGLVYIDDSYRINPRKAYAFTEDVLSYVREEKFRFAYRYFVNPTTGP